MKTTSYEISKQLYEAGFESWANFFWCELGKDLVRIHLSQLHVVPQSVKRIVAYDLETILEALPEEINLEGYCQELLITKNLLAYQRATGAWDFEQIRNENESLTDTAARLLILLHKKGMVNFN